MRRRERGRSANDAQRNRPSGARAARPAGPRARRMGVLLAVVGLVAGACSSGSSGDDAAATTSATIRVVNQNLLHGTACPADSNRCDLPGRVALFLRQLTRAKCPTVVAIEEGNATTARQLRRHLPG